LIFGSGRRRALTEDDPGGTVTVGGGMWRRELVDELAVGPL